MDERSFWLRLWQSLGAVAIIIVSVVMLLIPGCNESAASRWERRCRAVKEAVPNLDPAAQVLLIDRAFPSEGRDAGAPK